MTTTTKTLSAAKLAIIALAAACLALCCALPAPAHAADLQTAKPASASKTLATQKAKVYKIKTAAQWHNIGNYKGGTFKLMNNITLKSTGQYLTINKKYAYTIDLNGKKIKTNYSGNAARSAPLSMTKGTVTVKSSQKNKGVLYSTEFFAVDVAGGKFCLESGSIVDDYVDFRNDACSAICVSNNAKCVLKGGKVRGVCNGVTAMDSASVRTQGSKTSPYIRAGAHDSTVAFTHFGSAINIASRTAKLSLKGGSLGTKADPDAPSYSVVGTYYYTQSGHYPVLDMYGQALKQAKGYKFIDPSGNDVPIRQDALNSTYPGASPKTMLETWTKSSDGYYTVYVTKS
ncbi:MAG: hypothetical protein IJ131_08165 [Eggerthellaceae bacterium]|nr:hypothetical protein [Eggerthellaceae bacterium]MBQ9069018.1 hypothetical protein [Eggerthellaceae bacterium]